jgi:hypothetical protein
MAYPDRKKLAEVLEGGGPIGADPTAAGEPAPPEAGPAPGTPGPAAAVAPQGAPEGAMPGMPQVTAIPPEAADMAASLGLGGAGGGEEMPPEMGAEEGTIMPGNLSPQEQEQVQQALAMAARRRMVGGY